MPDEDRRSNPGRRETDRLLDALWRELDGLERDLRRDLERLERQLDRLEGHLEGRVDQLETFHIQERAKMGERLAERDDRMRTLTRVSLAFGIVGTLWGGLATVLHL